MGHKTSRPFLSRTFAGSVRISVHGTKSSSEREHQSLPLGTIWEDSLHSPESGAVGQIGGGQASHSNLEGKLLSSLPWTGKHLMDPRSQQGQK